MEGGRSQPGIHKGTPLKAKMTEKKSGPVTQGKGQLDPGEDQGTSETNR